MEKLQLMQADEIQKKFHHTPQLFEKSWTDQNCSEFLLTKNKKRLRNNGKIFQKKKERRPEFDQ